jgi:hypothetical protein
VFSFWCQQQLGKSIIMPGTVSDGPSVSLSFANNFWGKDDAGVEPLLSRMHNAKQTCDELKAFYQGV